MTTFSPLSRYALTDIATFETDAAQPIAYLRRRLLPAPERFALLQLYEVQAGDRIDNVAARILGDPELFWRICDANRVLQPEQLVERAGRLVRITLPQGVPGVTGA